MNTKNIAIMHRAAVSILNTRGGFDPMTAAEFSRRFGLTYTNHLIWAQNDIISRDITGALLKDMVVDQSEDIVAYVPSDHSYVQAHDAVVPEVCLAELPVIKEYGVFSRTSLEVGVVVGVYSGRIISSFEGRGSEYLAQYDRAHYIDARHIGNFTRFINHDSLQPNLMMLNVRYQGWSYNVFITIRPVKHFDQLFFDYGSDYWRVLRKQEIRLPQNLRHIFDIDERV